MQRTHTLDELRRLVQSPEGLRPTPSAQPVLGPLITFLRKSLWKLLGIRQTLEGRNQRLVELLSEMERDRPLVRYQMPESAFSFREGTQDWSIFNATFLANEYRLPDALEPDDVVIDIGTHIGSFSYLALVRGAGRVYSFEPDVANFELATRNLRVFGDRVRLERKAVWRSDRKNDDLYASDRIGPNTGGGCLIWMESGEKLEVVALDDVIDEATEGGRKRIKVLKVDCEGSEYPILLTSRKLHLVDTICGEYHNINLDTIARGGHQINEPKRYIPERARVDGVEHYDSSVIAAYLEKVGFRVTLEPAADDPQLGFFFGQRA
jgi:FkbM family methyltransferase